MNWTVSYTEGAQFVRIITAGVFNPSDHLRMIDDIVSRDFWKPEISLLLDNRDLDFTKVNYEMMKKAASNHEKNDARVGGGKIAILMKSMTDFGLGRQYEILTEGRVSARIHVFRDEEEAVNWLSARNYQIP